jgi:hypothetical protein
MMLGASIRLPLALILCTRERRPKSRLLDQPPARSANVGGSREFWPTTCISGVAALQAARLALLRPYRVAGSVEPGSEATSTNAQLPKLVGSDKMKLELT